MQGTLWHHCLKHLEGEVPEQQFNTWVRPLQAVERDGELQLLAPNRFVVSWIEKIPFEETRGYVQRVLENSVVYDRLNPTLPGPQPVHISAYLGKSSRPG